jgi:hypothetical protein
MVPIIFRVRRRGQGHGLQRELWNKETSKTSHSGPMLFLSLALIQMGDWCGGDHRHKKLK